MIASYELVMPKQIVCIVYYTPFRTAIAHPFLLKLKTRTVFVHKTTLRCNNALILQFWFVYSLFNYFSHFYSLCGTMCFLPTNYTCAYNHQPITCARTINRPSWRPCLLRTTTHSLTRSAWRLTRVHRLYCTPRSMVQVRSPQLIYKRLVLRY